MAPDSLGAPWCGLSSGVAHEVRCLDDNSRGANRRLGPVTDRVDLVVGDVRDQATVRAAARGMDSVCHLAYINGTEFFYERPELVLEVAVKGMMNVLDACLAEGVLDLIVASSSEVYQNAPVIPTPEDVPLVVPDVANRAFPTAAARSSVNSSPSTMGAATSSAWLSFGRTMFTVLIWATSM